MMKRYLLIFLLSGMDTGALKAEKVLDGFDEEPFEQPVILPEKRACRLRRPAWRPIWESLPPAEREKPSVPCLLQVVELAANRWPALNGKAGTDWIAAELFFQLNSCSRMPGNPFSRLVQGCCFPAPFPPRCSWTPCFRGILMRIRKRRMKFAVPFSRT